MLQACQEERLRTTAAIATEVHNCATRASDECCDTAGGSRRKGSVVLAVDQAALQLCARVRPRSTCGLTTCITLAATWWLMEACALHPPSLPSNLFNYLTHPHFLPSDSSPPTSHPPLLSPSLPFPRPGFLPSCRKWQPPAGICAAPWMCAGERRSIGHSMSGGFVVYCAGPVPTTG